MLPNAPVCFPGGDFLMWLKVLFACRLCFTEQSLPCGNAGARSVAIGQFLGGWGF
uniref:Uncharacterized protein n=1 Tax=Anguilla anguilla TaxID=7936 RepID=A0A0E9SU75_ANGAN